jgi:hypothetical protein
MRSLTILLIAVVAVTGELHAESHQAQSGDVVSPEVLREGTTSREFSEISRFLKLVRHPGIRSIRKTDREPSSGKETAYFSVNTDPAVENACMEWDEENRLVRRYQSPLDAYDTLRGTDKQRISETEAFKLAVPILKYYEMPLDAAEYSIELAQRLPRKNADDKYRFSWDISRQASYEGVPFRDHGFSMRMGAYTEKVLYAHCPVAVKPEPCAKRITRRRALEVGMAYVEGSGFFRRRETGFSPDAEERMQEIIAMPNINFDGPPPPEGIESGKAYYCWEVPFWIWNSRLPEGVPRIDVFLWVTMETGQFIGGR